MFNLIKIKIFEEFYAIVYHVKIRTKFLSESYIQKRLNIKPSLKSLSVYLITVST